MRRRKFLSGVAASAGVAFSGGTLSRTAWAQARPEVTRLSFGFGLDPVFAPHMVAMQKGWFRDAGFSEVTTKTFTGGAIAGEALVAGEISLWTPGNLPPISMSHSGVPIVVLGTNALAMSADRLVARSDANVKAPEDLYNIRIGLLQGSTASADLYYLAKHYKLDEKRLQVVNMPPPEQLAALNSGSTVLIHTGLKSGFAENSGQDAQISYTRSLFVASQEFVRKNPIATRRMMEVLLRAQRYVADAKNRDEVITLFVKETKQDRALADAIWDQYTFDPVFDERYVRDMERLSEFLVATGRLKSPKHPLEYTFTDPIAAADPALVKVPGRFKA
jgi:taurine transport system substrate-binding protein